MKLFGRAVAGLFLLIFSLVAAASFWFWFTPVTLNNYLNKSLIQLSLRSPQLMTSLGLIDGSPKRARTDSLLSTPSIALRPVSPNSMT